MYRVIIMHCNFLFHLLFFNQIEIILDFIYQLKCIPPMFFLMLTNHTLGSELVWPFHFYFILADLFLPT